MVNSDYFPLNPFDNPYLDLDQLEAWFYSTLDQNPNAFASLYDEPFTAFSESTTWWTSATEMLNTYSGALNDFGAATSRVDISDLITVPCIPWEETIDGMSAILASLGESVDFVDEYKDQPSGSILAYSSTVHSHPATYRDQEPSVDFYPSSGVPDAVSWPFHDAGFDSYRRPPLEHVYTTDDRDSDKQTRGTFSSVNPALCRTIEPTAVSTVSGSALPDTRYTIPYTAPLASTTSHNHYTPSLPSGVASFNNLSGSSRNVDLHGQIEESDVAISQRPKSSTVSAKRKAPDEAPALGPPLAGPTTSTRRPQNKPSGAKQEYTRFGIQTHPKSATGPSIYGSMPQFHGKHTFERPSKKRKTN